jgi:hypothetical protein
MYNGKKRYYSPQLSEKACITIRRLAWAFNVSMPKAIDIIIYELSTVFQLRLFVRNVRTKLNALFAVFSNRRRKKKRRKKTLHKNHSRSSTIGKPPEYAAPGV